MKIFPPAPPARSGGGYFMAGVRFLVPVLLAGVTALSAAPSSAQAANTVALSGVVSQGGVPVAGMIVHADGQSGGQSFGLSATSAADGSFTLNVPPDGTLNFDGDATLPSGSLHFEADGLAVGSQDITENVPLPAAAQVNISTADAAGDPLAGAGVAINSNSGDAITSTLADGTPVQYIWSASEFCTTDSTGSCALAGLIGFSPQISANYQAGPSYPAYSVTAFPAITADPTPVTLTFTHFTLTPQVISFTGPGSGAVGGSVTLSATGGDSGNPVQFSIDPASGSGVCSLSPPGSADLVFTSTGTCVVNANQAGNSSYAPAPQVQQSIVVGQGSQKITFAALPGKTLAQSPLTISATASSGLTVTFSSSTPAVCTVTADTVTLISTGTCSISANQAGNANYSPAPTVTRSFTVSQASQKITFAALSGKTLVQSPLTISATASSGLTVTFSSSTPAVCTVTADTVTLLTTGTCTISANQAGNATYLAAPTVTRSFTVR